MQWIIAIVILYFIGDINTVTQTDTNLPFIEVVYMATGSKGVATFYVVAIGVVNFIALFNVFASVSRLTWAFAVDNGLHSLRPLLE